MTSRPRKLSGQLLVLGFLSAGLWACGSSGNGNAGTGGSGTGGSGTGGSGTGGSGTGGTGGTGTGGTGGATKGTGGSGSGGTTQGSGGAPGTGGATRPSDGGSTGTATGGTSGPGGSTGRGDGGPGIGGRDAGPGGSTSPGGSTGGGGTTGPGGSTGGGGTTGPGGSTGGGGSTAAGCSASSKPADGTKNLTVDSIARNYILHVPSGYKGDSPVPLVLDFHPIGGSASEWRSGSPYPAVIDKEGVISAFPDGLKGPMGQAWNVVGCCVSQVNGKDVDDVAFARAIVADIEKVACIDTKRIYAVGFSMGGGMSNWLACKAADMIAAAGPASFDLTKQNQDQCTPTRPITVIEWRGKTDTVVCYDGCHSTAVSGMALDFLGAVGTFQKWASIDKCTGSPSAADSNGCQTYSECDAGVQVTLCTDKNGGHEAAKADIVWPWLKKYTLP